MSKRKKRIRDCRNCSGQIGGCQVDGVCQTTATIAEMLAEVQGYQPHFNQIDFDVATEEKCSCGRQRQYRGFKFGDSYRCFSVCETCDIAEEF